ncbi:MAG TPA: IMP cyclohydrolase [Candidatus Hydrogenedentes bacterium]|nr:IMP cyclohydrolase [Candidatus Hydrogenedentota bacterium]HOC72306.1 IMP cyclohydrolase [Candidatus Hydrogenedentota bacterium]HOH50839.1 IMP cyclohydrolase [Candidatus Hydrogenedentota bacterium]HQL94823.1 IMP cyclohydrolase [Candidatus Hydrogenedentota bacterium]HRZ82993.1 IMP cyclohydrolase [Candidatus Hydrogenedentota bacterium]
MTKVSRAILSCHDKTGLVGFAQLLNELGVEIISTSGTLSVLREAGIHATSIAEFTGVPELMNGRVKSLHPKVHAGLLGVRDNKLHVEQLQAYDMKWIDMVVVNLQPVSELAARPGVTPDEVFEQIDIGGVAMLRSAAKNFRYVAPIVNPERYPAVMHEMRALEGGLSYAARFRLAQEAFSWTADYDRAIARYLESTAPPSE